MFYVHTIQSFNQYNFKLDCIFTINTLIYSNVVMSFAGHSIMSIDLLFICNPGIIAIHGSTTSDSIHLPHPPPPTIPKLVLPSCTEMIWGWPSLVMISISLRIRVRSARPLILFLRIVLIAY